MTRLSKSRFLKGRQCLRRLWLLGQGILEPALEDEEVWELREAEGAEVERVVAMMFPGALRIDEAPEDDEAGEQRTAVEGRIGRTRQALEEGRPLLQAHLATDELIAISDLLEPRDGGWFLWEVKASTGLKAMFDWDLAFQVEVARRAEVTVVGAGVMHLCASHVRAGEIDPELLIVSEDRSAAVEDLRPSVDAEIRRQLAALAEARVPEARPGTRCKASRDGKDGDRPSTCGHLDPEGHCGKLLPPNWAGRLPRLTGAKATFVAHLEDPSIELLDPEDARAKWTPLQQRVIRAVQGGRAFVDSGALRAQLDRLTWPVAYVDFEFDSAMAVPRYEGTSPYTRIPFQWSMHVQQSRGAQLEVAQPFLHLGSDDPRRPFAESLRAALPATGSVVVHSKAAEQGVLDQLGAALGSPFAELAVDVRSRVFDTRKLIEAGYYHPTQQGSFSIKKIAPALLGRGYEGLALQDGMAAVVAWKQACADGIEPAERERLRGELLAYCGRDTELMHELIEAIRALVS